MNHANDNRMNQIIIIITIIIIFSGSAAQRGLWLHRLRGFVITHNDPPQSVGLIWTSDQPVVETSTRQHTTDKHPCPRWDFFFLPIFARVVYVVSLVLFWYLDEGLRAVDFSIMKNPTASVGSEPTILGTRGQHAHP
jgi:hypothetical protein